MTGRLIHTIAVLFTPLLALNAFAATVNAAPTISSIAPNIAMLGTTVAVTITGTNFGATSPTANLPPGVSISGASYDSATSAITGNLSVAYSAIIGNSLIGVTAASGLTSTNAVSFTANGPVEMIVQSDVLEYFSDNVTIKDRAVTYLVQNFDGTPTRGADLAENFQSDPLNCTVSPSPPVQITTNQCNGDASTNSDPDPNPPSDAGTFTDRWSILTSGYGTYAPDGCGYNNIVDHWQWCAPGPPFVAGLGPVDGVDAPITIGTLNGYAHTDADEIFATVYGAGAAYVYPAVLVTDLGPMPFGAVIKP